MARDDFDEEGVNARSNFGPMARLDLAVRMPRLASLVWDGGRAAAYPDLNPIHDGMRGLITLSNREMPSVGRDRERG